jgi:hypothetical protein
MRSRRRELFASGHNGAAIHAPSLISIIVGRHAVVRGKRRCGALPLVPFVDLGRLLGYE